MCFCLKFPEYLILHSTQLYCLYSSVLISLTEIVVLHCIIYFHILLLTRIPLRGMQRLVIKAKILIKHSFLNISNDFYTITPYYWLHQWLKILQEYKMWFLQISGITRMTFLSKDFLCKVILGAEIFYRDSFLRQALGLTSRPGTSVSSSLSKKYDVRVSYRSLIKSLLYSRFKIILFTLNYKAIKIYLKSVSTRLEKRHHMLADLWQHKSHKPRVELKSLHVWLIIESHISIKISYREATALVEAMFHRDRVGPTRRISTIFRLQRTSYMEPGIYTQRGTPGAWIHHFL